MRLHLFGDLGLSTAGVSLDLGGGDCVMLFGTLTNLLSDGDGHRTALDWRGSSSMKPCVKHFNVLRKDSDLAHRADGFVEITCSDCTLFRPWTTAEAVEAMSTVGAAEDRRRDGRMTKAALDQIQKTLGLNYNEHGVLADLQLCERIDVIGSITWDWVHSALQDGMFTVEATALLRQCKTLGVRCSDLEAFLSDDKWMFPMASSAKAKELHRVFSTWRNHDGELESIRGQASELLGLYGLLRHYVETVIGDDPRVAAHKASFDAACRVLDIILRAKRGRADVMRCADELRVALAEHLRAHKITYGTRLVRPKHHWLMDLPDQLRRDGCVLDAFVIERIHLQCKRIAEHVKNTSRFERSVLAGIANAAARCRSEATAADGLCGKVRCVGGEVQASSSLRAGQHTVSCGDVVTRDGGAGVVVMCLDEAAELLVAVEVLAFRGQRSAHSGVWQATGTHELWLAGDVEPCLAWYANGAGQLVVLQV